MKFFIFIILIALMVISCLVLADRLPNQTPENQVISIGTVIDSTGSVDTTTDLKWVVTTPGAIETGTIANHSLDDGRYSLGIRLDSYYYPAGRVIGDVLYKDTILTNGGKIVENKNFNLDSKDKIAGIYNVESSKVLTYTGTEGAHMVGEEEYTLDVAAEAKMSNDTIRCVFASGVTPWLPPFCNIVSAKSSLVNINSAKISTRGQMRAVQKTDDVPAELNYQIAITPDEESGTGFAKGTVETTYAGSVMEGRDSGMYLTQQGAHELNNWYHTHRYNPGDPVDWDSMITGVNPYTYFWTNETEFKTSAEHSWKDSTTVTGGIKNFEKAFAYKSGFRI